MSFHSLDSLYMSFARISQLLDTKNRIPKETNELTELIQNHASENVITHLDAKIDKLEDKVDAKIDKLEYKVDAKIDKLEYKVDATKEILEAKIDATNQRIDETNQRFDSLKKSNRWIIGLLVGIGSAGLGVLGILVRILINIT